MQYICVAYLFIFRIFIYFLTFWLWWIFVAACGLSLIAVTGATLQLQCASLSLQWLLLLQSPGFRVQRALVVVAHRLRCPTACGIFSAAVAAALSLLSHVRLFATSWTVAQQAPLSMGFPRQEYWSGLPFPSLGDLLDPEIKPMSPAWVLHQWATWKAQSPQPRNQTHVPCIGGWILKYWTTREVQPIYFTLFLAMLHLYCSMWLSLVARGLGFVGSVVMAYWLL